MKEYYYAGIFVYTNADWPPKTWYTLQVPLNDGYDNRLDRFDMLHKFPACLIYVVVSR